MQRKYGDRMKFTYDVHCAHCGTGYKEVLELYYLNRSNRPGDMDAMIAARHSECPECKKENIIISKVDCKTYKYEPVNTYRRLSHEKI